jgi:preprotein translocase subunit SecA
VTVATNMAGRGVDIVLGGETPKNADGTVTQNSPEYKNWEKEHDEVLELGGLYVIGTERHESRRIDNQLRGRSGRQGDPGATRFFVALADDIMRLFGGDRIAGLMTRFNMPEDVPLEHPLVTKSIENAQVKVEGFNFDTRKHLVEYDDVLNKQREIIYGRRRKILESILNEESTLKETIQEKIHDAISGMVEITLTRQPLSGNSIDEEITDAFNTIIPFDDASKAQLTKQIEQYHDADAKIEYLTKIADDLYDKREGQIGTEIARQIEKFIMLSVIDNLWTNHLDAIDNLRGGIGLRGYAQRDPLVEYKNEAFKMFEQLIWAIDDEVVHRIYKVQVQQPATSSIQTAQTHTHADGSIHSGPAHPVAPVPVAKNQTVVTNTPPSEISENNKSVNIGNSKKLGRNDPCWCGSGKKWKKCHYPQEG